MKLFDEFTKLIVFAVMMTYFYAVEIGSDAVRADPMQLDAFLAFVGGVTGVTIAYYCWKAKNQNIVDMQKRGNISATDNEDVARLNSERQAGEEDFS